MKMTQNQTVANPKKKTDPPEIWNGRTQYTTPKGKELWLTELEKSTAIQIEKLHKAGKLSKTVSPASLNKFFKQRVILELEGFDKWFAKQYYKAYIIDWNINEKQLKKAKKLVRDLVPKDR